jgi:NTP pyrophosphatase (non-canonical NTP hydrolase)
MNIPEYCKEAHRIAKEKGFHDREFNLGERLMLATTELGEALEAHRTGRIATQEGVRLVENNFDVHDSDFNIDIYGPVFELYVKDTFQDEIADAIIWLLDLCEYLKIDIEKFIQLKMVYNGTRKVRHGKRY